MIPNPKGPSNPFFGGETLNPVADPSVAVPEMRASWFVAAGAFARRASEIFQDGGFWATGLGFSMRGKYPQYEMKKMLDIEMETASKEGVLASLCPFLTRGFCLLSTYDPYKVDHQSNTYPRSYKCPMPKVVRMHDLARNHE